MLLLMWESLLIVGFFSRWASCQTQSLTSQHPPVPAASFPALPSEFNDIPGSYQKCWTSFYDYSFTRNFLFTEFAKSSTRIVTTFNPPRTGISTYSGNAVEDCSTTLFGTTILCDNATRASSHQTNCRTRPTIGTVSWTEYQSDITTITPTWTSQFQKPSPTCKVASDLSPVCSRMFDAWRWHTAQWSSQKPVPTDITTRIYNAVPQCTPLTYTPSPSAQPLCRISASLYQAYHWPKPAPSGSAFCTSDATLPSKTLTIPNQPSTTVVSGHTLTSPSIYHFLKNVQVETYIGAAIQPGGLGPQARNIWAVSSFIPADKPLTVAQLESQLLTVSETCIGRELDYCSLHLNTGFRVHDISTVRSEIYRSHCVDKCFGEKGGVIYQTAYRPTIAIPVSDVMRQNGDIFRDCFWVLDDYSEGGWRTYYSSETAAVLVTSVASTAFVPIMTPTIGMIRTVSATPGATLVTAVRPSQTSSS
ncbi:hypothetical protein B0J11DRAFT_589965 [Dendryphion nanum]|uniref:Uncharacterized protein n=1 Tax=Dendryphion nanum TaxID=256645 RepID=A0A9P9DLD5_9PLEO|nr:hypothetical protein B0J11DRAFT_589965 [Dendryphion nanum]